MASPSSIIVLALAFAIMSMLVHSRPLTNVTTNGAQSLTVRLKLDQNGSLQGCWESLFEIQACTGEIVLFFLNGETFLGTGCCRAIENIERQCWPSLMGSLGFTSQEGDVLRGYCDVSGSSEVPTTSPSPPPPPPRSRNITTTISRKNGRF